MSHEPVGNRLDISTGSANWVVEIILVHGARVISAESLIVVAVSSIQLLQAIPGRSALGTVANHLENAALGIIRVESDTSVGLHDARVTDTVVRGTDADVAARFLHDDAQDDAFVDAGLGADFLNGFLDEVDLAGAVVEGHEGGVLGPESLIAGPVTWIGEVGSWAAVLDIATTNAGTARGTTIVTAWGTSTAGEVDYLANLKGAGVYSRVGGLDGADGSTVGLGDRPEGVA